MRGMWLMLALACLLSGCVHRRVTVTTEPPGATLLLEGEEVGVTPCSFDFTYYGTREFTLIKDGFETLTVQEKICRPWYQVLPFEFVADNFSPTKINDRRRFHYPLKPQVLVPKEDLLQRGNGIRAEVDVPQ